MPAQKAGGEVEFEDLVVGSPRELGARVAGRRGEESRAAIENGCVIRPEEVKALGACEHARVGLEVTIGREGEPEIIHIDRGVRSGRDGLVRHCFSYAAAEANLKWNAATFFMRVQSLPETPALQRLPRLRGAEG